MQRRMITQAGVDVGVNGDEGNVVLFGALLCFSLTSDEAWELGRWLQEESQKLMLRQAVARGSALQVDAEEGSRE